MLEPMTVWVEVWAVAADETDLWLLNGAGPWLDGPVMADNSEDFMAKMLLREHSIREDELLWTHFTSWHPDGPRHVDTYLAVVDLDAAAVFERFPLAAPIVPDIYDNPEVGRPPTHGATEEPVPRSLDVLYHALGHLKEQIRKNATTRLAVGDAWRIQLEPYEETLAGMYSEPHRAA